MSKVLKALLIILLVLVVVAVVVVFVAVLFVLFWGDSVIGGVVSGFFDVIFNALRGVV
jgi:hypothetical protein